MLRYFKNTYFQAEMQGFVKSRENTSKDLKDSFHSAKQFPLAPPQPRASSRQQLNSPTSSFNPHSVLKRPSTKSAQDKSPAACCCARTVKKNHSDLQDFVEEFGGTREEDSLVMCFCLHVGCVMVPICAVYFRC